MTEQQTTAPETQTPEQVKTPVEQVDAPKETEETAQTPEADPVDGDDQQQKPRKPGKTERELRRLQRHVETLTQALQSLSGGGHDAGKPQAEPTPDQFAGGEIDPKYLLERAKWEFRQEQMQEARAAEQRTIAERQRATIDAGRDKFADFDDVMADAVISPPMASAILESNIGADIAYHLGTHPEDALRISKLPPIAAAKEIGRIEAKLSAAPPPKKQTAVPPPPPTVTGRASAALQDPAKMTMEDYVKWRQAGNG